MSENIVEQINRIEAEADRIVADATRRSRELEDGTEDEIRALRREHERALGDRLEALKAKLGEQAAAQLRHIDEQARQARQRLESLDPRALERAGELILSRLLGDAPWP